MRIKIIYVHTYIKPGGKSSLNEVKWENNGEKRRVKGLLFYMRMREALSIKMAFVQITIKRGSQAHGYLLIQQKAPAERRAHTNGRSCVAWGVRRNQNSKSASKYGGKLHKQWRDQRPVKPDYSLEGNRSGFRILFPVLRSHRKVLIEVWCDLT